jgi:AraC-like DNA-binding protein
MNTNAKRILESADICAKEQIRADISTLFENILNHAKKTDISSAASISHELHGLFNMVIQNKQYDDTSNESKIIEAARYIRTNYRKPLSIEEMAGYIHLSKYYFIRLFKRSMGVTPYKYILNTRITEAKILLRTTDVSVGEISERGGFMDESNFIAAFKKQSGMKPLEYRRCFFESILKY